MTDSMQTHIEQREDARARDALIANLYESGLPAVAARQRRVAAVAVEFGGNHQMLAQEVERLREALAEAVAVIEDYLAYEHNGDPWVEDARTMGEMDINDYATDGRLARARSLLAKRVSLNPPTQA